MSAHTVCLYQRRWLGVLLSGLSVVAGVRHYSWLTPSSRKIPKVFRILYFEGSQSVPCRVQSASRDVGHQFVFRRASICHSLRLRSPFGNSVALHGAQAFDLGLPDLSDVIVSHSRLQRLTNAPRFGLSLQSLVRAIQFASVVSISLTVRGLTSSANSQKAFDRHNRHCTGVLSQVSATTHG